ncbi:MAG: DNA alkylation repair protein [Armatimonadota bacterium]
MTTEEILAQLQALGSEKGRQLNARHGAGENQFGVKMGDIRAVAKPLKKNPELAAELWCTGISDAMLLAVLLMDPKRLSVDELEAMVSAATYPQLADWLNSYVVKQHPRKEQLRQQWIDSPDPMLGRSAWSLTAARVEKDPAGLDLAALLDRLEAEMGSAPAPTQWTMNFTLAAIGIHHPEHRERALAIGEKLGLYRDYPTPKGCTSPFAPIWITEMVRRQG